MINYGNWRQMHEFEQAKISALLFDQSIFNRNSIYSHRIQTVAIAIIHRIDILVDVNLLYLNSNKWAGCTGIHASKWQTMAKMQQEKWKSKKLCYLIKREIVNIFVSMRINVFILSWISIKNRLQLSSTVCSLLVKMPLSIASVRIVNLKNVRFIDLDSVLAAPKIDTTKKKTNSKQMIWVRRTLINDKRCVYRFEMDVRRKEYQIEWDWIGRMEGGVKM